VRSRKEGIEEGAGKGLEVGLRLSRFALRELYSIGSLREESLEDKALEEGARAGVAVGAVVGVVVVAAAALHAKRLA
jgi:hypothetical protein